MALLTSCMNQLSEGLQMLPMQHSQAGVPLNQCNGGHRSWIRLSSVLVLQRSQYEEETVLSSHQPPCVPANRVQGMLYDFMVL